MSAVEQLFEQALDLSDRLEARVATGRVPGRFAPGLAAELHQGPFVLQEPALAVDPAAETRQLPA